MEKQPVGVKGVFQRRGHQRQSQPRLHLTTLKAFEVRGRTQASELGWTIFKKCVSPFPWGNHWPWCTPMKMTCSFQSGSKESEKKGQEVEERPSESDLDENGNAFSWFLFGGKFCMVHCGFIISYLVCFLGKIEILADPSVFS